MEPTWCPPGSCRPQVGPMLAPKTLLSGLAIKMFYDPEWLQVTYIYPCCIHWGQWRNPKGYGQDDRLPNHSNNAATPHGRHGASQVKTPTLPFLQRSVSANIVEKVKDPATDTLWGTATGYGRLHWIPLTNSSNAERDFMPRRPRNRRTNYEPCAYFLDLLYKQIAPSLVEYSSYFNSLRPSDAYMRQQNNHHWFI